MRCGTSIDATIMNSERYKSEVGEASDAAASPGSSPVPDSTAAEVTNADLPPREEAAHLPAPSEGGANLPGDASLQVSAMPEHTGSRSYSPASVAATLPGTGIVAHLAVEVATPKSDAMESAIAAALQTLKHDHTETPPAEPVSSRLVISPVQIGASRQLSGTVTPNVMLSEEARRPQSDSVVAQEQVLEALDTSEALPPASRESASSEATPFNELAATVELQRSSNVVETDTGTATPIYAPPSGVEQENSDADFVVTQGGTAVPLRPVAVKQQEPVQSTLPSPIPANEEDEFAQTASADAIVLREFEPGSHPAQSPADQSAHEHIAPASAALNFDAIGQSTAATAGPLAIDPDTRVLPVPGDLAPAARRDYWRILRRVARFTVYAIAAWIVLVLGLIALYRFVDPPMSALMVQKALSGEALAHEWVAIDNVSPSVVRAVIASEDARFCEHHGVDFDALGKAMQQYGGKSLRGASTISMQVVKNLFLWPSKSLVRKAVEFPLTFVLELVWPKRRIMEVYLNIAEWGPGIFGVASASEFHFRKLPLALTEREAARLAVALPNPLERNAGRPGPGTLRLAQFVQHRMRALSAGEMACVGLVARR